METFKPTSEFEQELAGLLSASGQSVNTAAKYDELPLNQLDPAQVSFLSFSFHYIVIIY